MPQIKLTHRERGMIFMALRNLLKSDGADPKILYRAGRILDVLDDDEREKYYTELSTKYRKLESEWIAAGSTGPQPRVSKEELDGELREFTLLDSDYGTVKEALSRTGWWIGEDGKSVEDPRACRRLLEKFGLGE
jgi:hypothetical protein